MKGLRRISSVTPLSLVMLFFAFGGALLVAQPPTDYYRSLALDITAEAVALAERDSIPLARQLMERAYALDPRSSDVLHVRAFLDKDNQSLFAAVQADFEEALRINDYRLVTSDHTRTYLAELYLRSGQSTSATQLFARLRFDPTALWRYQYLNTQLSFGPRWTAAQLAERLPREYPTDHAMARIVLEREQVLSVDLLQWIERAVALVGARDPAAGHVAAVIMHAIRVASPGHPVIPLLVHWYYEFGGSDMLPAVVYPAAAARHLPDARRTALNVRPLDKEILERIGGDEVAAQLGSAHSPFVATLEPRRDGFVEQYYHFDAAGLRLWRQDIDSNGRVDLALQFDELGRAQRFSAWWAGQIVRIEYGNYPTVQRMWWWRGAHWWLWEVVDSIPLPLEGLEWPLRATDAQFIADRVLIDETALERFLRATERFRGFGRPLPDTAVGVEWEREWGFFLVTRR